MTSKADESLDFIIDAHNAEQTNNKMSNKKGQLKVPHLWSLNKANY
jgi:hypothetical protein